MQAIPIFGNSLESNVPGRCLSCSNLEPQDIRCDYPATPPAYVPRSIYFYSDDIPVDGAGPAVKPNDFNPIAIFIHFEGNRYPLELTVRSDNGPSTK